MKKSMRKIGMWLAAVVVMSAAPVAAQDAPLQVGVGYQFLHLSADGEGTSLPVGFNVDVAGPLTRSFSWVGELGWAHDSDSEFGFDSSINALHVAAGGRWSGQYNMNLTPYAQVLLGAQGDSGEFDDIEFETEWNFLFQPGAGVTYSMGQWGVFGQVDYRRVFYEGQGANGFRFVAGARVNLP